VDIAVMVGFGYKQAWLAIGVADAVPVIAALGVRDLGEAPWRSGIDLAYFTPDRLAITPPLRGAGDGAWTLVTGSWLMTAPIDLASLSDTLGTEVQRFASHRVVEAHQWARALDGRVVRAFGYVGESGEITTWLGEPEPIEREIGLPPAIDDETLLLVGEDDVMRVAEAWSVDPTSLDGQPAPGPLRMAAVG
jgi:hypothetical protein